MGFTLNPFVNYWNCDSSCHFQVQNSNSILDTERPQHSEVLCSRFSCFKVYCKEFLQGSSLPVDAVDIQLCDALVEFFCILCICIYTYRGYLILTSHFSP